MMTTTNYINNNGLGLKVTQLPSGAFDLYFSNGFISTWYTEEELQDLIQRKGFSEMLTTYMNPQLTRLDVVTTGDGYLLVLNQVMELNK